MESTIFDRFRISLLEQRQNLTDWLRHTPTWKKRIRLGPTDERAAQAHLQVLDTALARTEDKTLGLCEVCHEPVETSYLEMDYTACVCLEHLSDEERRRLEYELELSQKVQQALLPQQVPDIPGVELAAFSRPAQIVGGDYFDFFCFRDNSHGLVIGDVAGHGMSASLLMASLQASLRTMMPENDSPLEVVERLNSLFYHNIRLSNFVTFFLGRFEPQTRRLTYCNAGHNPPLLYHPQQNGRESISWLQPTGAAIGLVEDFQFGLETVTLAPGDILLLYTDGVTEAFSPQEEEFGPERLAEVIRQASTLSAPDLLAEVRRRLQEFTNGRPLADDTTIVVCKIR
ncbi:MAG TPA: SpoIIE family protein phosphatase [Anaerolineae bacterium]|nr:SpoIIE family protein phosphatase [Anaerolineae bacterium]